jgi:predicted dehydrogenase
MRVGVIGRGFGERVVAPSFQATDGCEVVEVVSPRDEEAVAALCGRRDVDLISVHSPPFLHADHVGRAVAAGHDVLCDKPFGRNAREAAEMRELAAAAGVLHFLNFENRFDPARLSIRGAIARGAIGDPEHLAFTMLMSISRSPLRRYGWLFDADAGGGWLRAMGSHQVDFCRWTFGEIVEVSGQLRIAVPERPDATGNTHRCTADDGFILGLRTARGVSIAMDSSSAASVSLPPSMLVVGSRGVVVDAGGQVRLRTPDGDDELMTGTSGTNPLLVAMRAYAEVLRDAVHERHVPVDVPTFDDGLACAQVMDQLPPCPG